MSRFTFVHAADLHLASPFAGISSQSEAYPLVAKRVREATGVAYRKLVDLCLERRVEFLVIAGDVYNGANRSVRAQLEFRDGLARLADAGIRSFVAHGNHDPLSGWSASLRWPEGVHVFGKDKVGSVAVTTDAGVLACVHGISFEKRQETRNLAKQFSRDAHEVFQEFK